MSKTASESIISHDWFRGFPKPPAYAGRKDAMEIRRMLAGANHYYQGTDILDKVGEEAQEKGWTRALVLGGRKALSAAWPTVENGLRQRNIQALVQVYEGFNTAEDIDAYAALCAKENCSGIIGIGGGKIMDLAKAAAVIAGRPVFTVPTSAATCAAYAPLSVVYTSAGQQAGIRFHDREVDAVFVDLRIIANAPVRLLAAGMADAMAKTCEYSSTHKQLHYGDIDTAKYCGYCLSRSADEILLQCGAQAYQDVLENKVSPALEDAVFASIAVIGVVSGMCGYTNKPGGRFAIAHGFNEIIRGRWEKDPRKFLHGELVAVGILAQLYVNGLDEGYIAQVREFFRAIHVPCTLTDLGIVLDDRELEIFSGEIIGNSSIGATHGEQIRAAIRRVR